MSKPLIFLDIDGVLNDHAWDTEVMCGQIQQDKVARLNHILHVTGARIVLSSAWRYIIHRGESNLMGLEWLFRSHGILMNRLISYTRPDTAEQPPRWDGDLHTWIRTNERGVQIADWLAEFTASAAEQPSPYVAIDDLDLGISEAGHPFVQTNGAVGLTDGDVLQSIRLLGGQP